MTQALAILTIATALVAGVMVGNRRGIVSGVGACLGVIGLGVICYVLLVASMKM